MAELNFDAEKIEPLGNFEPIPLGEYLVVISSSEIKETKEKKGKYLQFTYDVIDGEYKNRKVFDRLNIVNESETSQEIAQRALSAICRAVGILHPKNSEELHDKPFMVKVGIRPAKGEYQASNIVKGYKKADGSPVSETTEEKIQSKGKNKKPWEK
jgi:hypothetical protein